MRIVSLSIERFRNHTTTLLEIGGVDVAVFLGPNGSGKTNILEAVGVLSLVKSPRGAEDEDLVQWGEGSYCIQARVQTDAGEEKTVELVCERSPRQRKAGFINDVRLPATRIVGVLPTVAFLPEDLDLFRGSPAGRRRFFDQLLCQVSPEYLQELVRYQRLLKQRNALLKHLAAGSAKRGELESWDAPLAIAGAAITVARLELVETLGVTLADECAALGLPWASVCLQYHRAGTARDPAALERQMLALLIAHRDRDAMLAATTVGPHRDDWRLAVDGRDVVSFASRGQERLALLALLGLEVSFLELRRGERPIVLLDDAFSELDSDHSALLLPALASSQVFLTSAHDVLKQPGMKLWHVEEGAVTAATKRYTGAHGRNSSP